MVDVTDSKSVGLIPRVGSSPTTGTNQEKALIRGAFSYFSLAAVPEYVVK